MSVTTIDKIREQHRVRANLSLLMALDALDIAGIKVHALAQMARQGITSDRLIQEARGNLERALTEIRRAEVETSVMPDKDEIGGGHDAA